MTEEPRTPKPKKPRGFAALSPEQRKAIASRGGKAVPPEKRTFTTNVSAAVEAGRKGGRAIPPEKRSFSRDPLLAANAGRAGGLRQKRNKPKPEPEN